MTALLDSLLAELETAKAQKARLDEMLRETAGWDDDEGDIVALSGTWEETKHHRGQPGNAGQFGPGGGQAAKAPQRDAPAQAGQGGGAQAKPQQQQADEVPEHVKAAQEDYQKNGVLAKAFLSWFGDWRNDPQNASKVVDAQGQPQRTGAMEGGGAAASKVTDPKTGRPVVVYHGTKVANLEEFRKDAGGNGAKNAFGRGFYFAASQNQAQIFEGPEGATHAVYLNIRKPFDLDKEFTRQEAEQITGQKWGLLKSITRLFNKRGPQTGNPTGHELFEAIAKAGGTNDAATNRMKELGYDGLTHTQGAIVKDQGPSGNEAWRVWVCFEPEQVKAANNRGTFDPHNPKIAMSAAFDDVSLSRDSKGHEHKGKGDGGGQFTGHGGGSGGDSGTGGGAPAKPKVKIKAVLSVVGKKILEKAGMDESHAGIHGTVLEVAKERGFTKEETHRLHSITAAVDNILGGRVIPAVLTAAGASDLNHAGIPCGKVPIASFAYLAYSTARNPLATLRVAARAVKRMFSPQSANEQNQASLSAASKDYVHAIAERMKAAHNQDLWHAAFCSAFDHTHSVHRSIMLADRVAGAKKVSLSSTYDESKHPRGEHGHWTFLEAAKANAKATYAVLHDAASDGFHALPEPVKEVVTDILGVAFTAWTVSQALAERIEQERGLTKEQAAQARSAMAAWDLAFFKPIAVATAPLGGMAAAATWIVPPVTGAYLLQSVVTHPLKTIVAAYKLIRDAASAALGRKTIELSAGAEPHIALVDALEAHGWDDWYCALLHAAIAEAKDIDLAIELADQVYDEHPEDTSEPQDDDADALFAAPVEVKEQKPRRSIFNKRKDDVALSARAPAGYTKEKPLQVQGHSYVGGEYIPGDVLAKANPAEKAAIKGQKPPEKQQKASPSATPAQPHQAKPPAPGDHRKDDYVKQAMANLKKTSRTAGGTVDTSASKGKADKMAEGLTGGDAAAKATKNFEAVISQLYDQRDHNYSDPTRVQSLCDNVNKELNRGITKEGVLLRTDDSDKFPYAKVADIPLARQQFAEEFAKRLSDPNADPIETAAWVEWRVNRDHVYADGCGKTQRALAAIPLMRANLPLPNYPDPKKFFAMMPKTAPDPKQGPESYTNTEDYKKFLNWYRMKCPAHGTRAVRQIEKHFPPANPLGVDALERHSTGTDAHGLAIYTPERAALHEKIAHKMRDHVPASKDKLYIMAGGGPASGKTSIIKLGLVKKMTGDPIVLPDKNGRTTSHVHIDSDAIKGELPEMKLLREQGDMRAADYVHEESSDTAKMVQNQSFAAGQDVLLDGTGDNSADSVEKKCKAARAAGYKVQAAYTTCSTEEAVRRNIIRAFGGPKAREMGYHVNDNEMNVHPEGRLPPEDMLRAVHKGVSTVLPELLRRAAFDQVTLHDTEHKTDGKPTLVMSAKGAEVTIHHPELWQAFLAKAK